MTDGPFIPSSPVLHPDNSIPTLFFTGRLLYRQKDYRAHDLSNIDVYSEIDLDMQTSFLTAEPYLSFVAALQQVEAAATACVSVMVSDVSAGHKVGWGRDGATPRVHPLVGFVDGVRTRDSSHPTDGQLQSVGRLDHLSMGKNEQKVS